jgi:hypothetical protein
MVGWLAKARSPKSIDYGVIDQGQETEEDEMDGLGNQISGK